MALNKRIFKNLES